MINIHKNVLIFGIQLQQNIKSKSSKMRQSQHRSCFFSSTIDEGLKNYNANKLENQMQIIFSLQSVVLFQHIVIGEGGTRYRTSKRFVYRVANGCGTYSKSC